MADEGLTHAEIARYSRHLIMPEVGVEGQRRLKSSSVLLVGAGGLGSPLGLYLAAAGVGRLGLVDFDVVDVSNLHRQVLYGDTDIGRPKLDAARERLADVNPHIELETHEVRLSSENALELLDGYDLVIDGTDNFPTRYLVNDACVLLGKPNIYGSIFRFEGQVSVFWAGHGPCYRCLYPEPPPPGMVPSCAEGGVLGILPGTVGALQATEAIKLLIRRGDPLLGRLLLFNALEMSFRELKIGRDPDCPVCGDDPEVTALIDYEQFCGVGDRPAPEVAELDPGELHRELHGGKSLQLIDVRSREEWEITHLPGARLIPLDELDNGIGELDRERPVVCICKLGGRSARAAARLAELGFRDVRSLRGGLMAWGREIDPEVPAY